MYNRYIPQPDGSFRRRPMPEPAGIADAQVLTGITADGAPQKHPPILKNSNKIIHRALPAGLDTGDLLVVALLLLIAGDQPENRSTALLTLAMYFML